MKLFFAFVSFICLQSCVGQPAPLLPQNKDNNSLLWEISGNGLKKPSYIYGTFHMMCKDDIRFGENVQKAINGAEEVYFEMDLDDPANTLGALLYMNMSNGKTLQDFVSADEYLRLEKFFKDSLRTALKTFQKMKPAMLEAFLYPKMLPCKTLSGVDQELVKMATRAKKEIKGFETIAFQSAVFDSIPYSQQAGSLLKTIDSLAKYRLFFDTMLRVYKTQRMEEIESLFSQSEFGMAEGMEFLLDRRNVNWVAQLKNILPTTNIFMAVGAGHLPGKMGIIALLKKEGYTLKPIVN